MNFNVAVLTICPFLKFVIVILFFLMFSFASIFFHKKKIPDEEIPPGQAIWAPWLKIPRPGKYSDPSGDRGSRQALPDEITLDLVFS
jgi:hypothetical protein